MPDIAAVAGAAALVTLSAACGASSGTSNAAAASSAATGQASAFAASSASAGTSKPSAGKSAAGKPASEPASSGKPTSSGVPAASAAAAGAGKAASAGELTGAAATALLAKAVANTQAAASVQVTGLQVPGANGQTESFDLTVVKGAGCAGSVTLTATRSFKFVETTGYVWMLPSDAYYAAMHLSKQSMAQVKNKYIKMKATDSRAADLATVCTFPGLLGQLDKPAGTAFAAKPATYDGSLGYRVTEAGQHGTAFVAKAPAPLLLQIADLQPDNGSITFADYNATTAITAPAAAETIDGTS